jgi:hypothetical protein
MATRQERNLILDMLASGKINVNEARDLFDAIDQCEEFETHQESFPFCDSVEKWVQNTRNEIADMVNRVKTPFVYIH